MELIKFSKVSFGYPNFPYLLSHFDFSIHHGDYYYLTGRNGAGKTTFLKLIYGEEQPILGDLFVFGVNTKLMNEAELASIRQNIGIVFQDSKLIPHLTLCENIALPLQILGEYKKSAMEKAKALLDWVDMSYEYAKKPDEISDGQKKRVCIARAVITKPLIILADEPTANLDIENSQKIMKLLETVNQNGTPIVCVTHHENIIEWYPHPKILLDKGILFFESKVKKKKTA
ncbi:MAG: ATP-binding cassette domain-containing protein [Alphaproteobacteria bacterium]|nr:MAG: ATP-binding cassette domain-containing protein [Alphaproteobacteria bacterium]